MKRNILILILLVFGSTAYAQQMKLTDDSLDKVVLSFELSGPEMANFEMKQELGLRDDQYDQVELLNESRFQKMMDAEQLYASNDIQLAKAFQSIALENDLTLKEVLDAQQMRQYLELEGRFNVQFVSDNDEKEN